MDEMKLLEEMESLSKISQGLTKKCISYQKEIKEVKSEIKTTIKCIDEHEELVGTIPQWIKIQLKEIVDGKMNDEEKIKRNLHIVLKNCDFNGQKMRKVLGEFTDEVLGS